MHYILIFYSNASSAVVLQANPFEWAVEWVRSSGSSRARAFKRLHMSLNAFSFIFISKGLSCEGSRERSVESKLKMDIKCGKEIKEYHRHPSYVIINCIFWGDRIIFETVKILILFIISIKMEYIKERCLSCACHCRCRSHPEEMHKIPIKLQLNPYHYFGFLLFLTWQVFPARPSPPHCT